METDAHRRVEQLEDELLTLELQNRGLKQQLKSVEFEHLKLNALQELAKAGTWELNRINYTVKVSPSLARLLFCDGPPSDSLSFDQFLQAFVSPDDATTAEKLRKVVVGNNEESVFDHVHRSVDGSETHLRNHCKTMYNSIGQPLVTIGLVIDITELTVQSLALKEANAKSNSASRAKSEFLANMSHEIRTPMNAIIGLCELSLRTALSPQQQDYATKIHLAANNLLGILNDILDISKIEAGRLEIEQVPFSLDELLDSLATVQSSAIEQKGLEFLFDRELDIPDELIGDSLRLGQVLNNLVSNARKFTESGEILVTIMKTHAPVGQLGLRFTVSDSGIGLSEAEQTRLFRPFSQADRSTTRRFGGTGLGLAISRELVERMGGRIWVESEPGCGSRFSFELSFDPADSPAPSPVIGFGPLTPRCLVIDDNLMAREITLKQLSYMGADSESAASAREAYDLIVAADEIKRPFDVVLMDYRMPDINGLEATRYIKFELKLSKIPKVIFVTAASRLADEKRETIRSLCEALLIKPVNSSVLQETLHSVLQGQLFPTVPKIHRAQFDYALLSGIQGAKILLVEDNSINQQVATELLEQAGFWVDVAENGKVALDRVQTHHYDAVLMDIQMPIMDGYQATREIRKLACMKDLPIIAMTANVMREDVERALDVGMNAHIAKPVSEQDLFTQLLNWIPQGDRQKPILKTETKQLDGLNIPADLPDINLADALLSVGGNRQLLAKLLREFYFDHADDVEQIRQALSAGNLGRAQRIAHTLKGIFGTFGAPKLSALFKSLELAIKGSRLTEVDSLLQLLDEAMVPLVARLKSWIESVDAPTEQDERLAAGEIQSRLKSLERLVEEMDPESADLAEALKRLLPEDSLIAQLADVLETFDFDTAMQILKAVEKRK